MGVPPGAQFRVFTKVVVAYIQSSDPRAQTLDNNYFLVVTKIDLEAIAIALTGIKRNDLNTRLAAIL